MTFYFASYQNCKLQIHSAPTLTHRRYLHNWSSLPMIAPEEDEQAPNALFAQLMEHHERRVTTAYPKREMWIAPDTWTLIDRWNAALRRLADPAELRTLRKAIRRKVHRDRANHLQATGDEIQAHLEAEDPREAWRLVKVWYRHHARAVPPTPLDLQAIETDFRALYVQRAPPGEPIRGLVMFQIPDNVPDQDEIAKCTKMLRSGRAPGPSGMTVEDLKRWYMDREAQLEPWNLVVQLVQHAFQTGMVPTQARSNTLVLIPKPEAGQVRGIGLLEPIWKLTSAIINARLMTHIRFHDVLHGFLPGRGTGTAGLEAKLEAQLAYRTGHPLYHVFLDFTKAYDSLDRARTLTILTDYGVGPNIIRLLSNFWEQHMVIPRQQQFYGDPFPADRGLTTGDIPAPVIYNIVTDAVLRQWYHDGASHAMTTRARFYADDGALRDQDPDQLQSALAAMEQLFRRVGLPVNGKKTKALTTIPPTATTTISAPAYKRRMNGEGEMYRERKQARISCPLCDTNLQARNLPTHYRNLHPAAMVPHPTDIPPTNTATPNFFLVWEPDKHATTQCPVPECAVDIVGGWYAMCHHFFFRHHHAEVTIVDKGDLP